MKAAAEKPTAAALKKAAAEKPTAAEKAALNTPGQWDFFVSYTQRNGKAEALAKEIYIGLKDNGLSGWLDTKMMQCDSAAMKEGVDNCNCLIAVVSGGEVKANRYFERSACVAELEWAINSSKPIVPVIFVLEKLDIGKYIAEGKSKGIDLSGCNFVDFNMSHPAMTKGSLEMLKMIMDQQLKSGTAAKTCTPDLTGEFKEGGGMPVQVNLDSGGGGGGGSVNGLTSLFTSLKLEDKLGAATKLCKEKGADDVADLKDEAYAEELAKELGLPEIKAKKLAKAIQALP